jgi:hypothetical protein
MKTYQNVIIVLVLFILYACNTIKTTPESTQENLDKIENRDFTIIANYANPMRMRQVYLTSEYTLKIKGDSAFALLPYYGVAHTAPLNPAEGGIKFSEPMLDYSSKPTKKADGREISFKVNTREYNYQINMTVFFNGSSIFVVNAYQRDAITFYGEMK